MRSVKGGLAGRLALAAIGALGAVALGSATSAHAQYPITGVTVDVTCTVSGSTAHCKATVTVQDSNGRPVSGASARFNASYSDSGGHAVAGPSNSSCGGMNPCSATTDSNGQATSVVDTGLCGDTITVTATVTNPSDGSTKSARGQASLNGCGGVAGITEAGAGLPHTSTAPPGADHHAGEAVLAGGGLLALFGAGALALRRRPDA